MAETLSPHPSPAERTATTNTAAFLHWLRAVHGVAAGSDAAGLRAWAEANPRTASTLIRHFAGTGFASARLAAGLLLQSDLRPDDRILVLGQEPAWLRQALAATHGRADNPAAATVLVADHPPDRLLPNLRRVILIGGVTLSLPTEITVSRPEDWTYPRESSAD